MTVYNDPNEFDTKPSTVPIFPRSPEHDDPRWCEVAVRSRAYSETDIKRIPTDDAGTEITTVFAGDTIAIMPEVKHHYYVAARVGYHVGWVNFKHVKLVSLQPRNRKLEETKPDSPQFRDERIDEYQEQLRRRAYEQQQYEAELQRRAYEQQQYEQELQRRDYEEQQYQEQRYYTYEQQEQSSDYDYEDTQPAPAAAPRKPPPIPKKDVNRIIDKLKSLGGMFSRR